MPCHPDQLPAIRERYLANERLEDIAKDFGVTGRTIYNWLIKPTDNQTVEDAQTDLLIGRMYDAEEEIAQAPDMLSFHKAHARAKLAHLTLERRRPQLYGPKQEVTQRRVTVIVNKPPAPIDVTPSVSTGTAVSTGTEQSLEGPETDGDRGPSAAGGVAE